MMLFVKKNITIIFLLCIANAHAQYENKLNLGTEFLKSTHGDIFSGINAGYEKKLTKNFSLGAGMEYSNTQKHDDNGWNLYHVKYLPFYISQVVYLTSSTNFKLFIHVREGLSFASYDKEIQANPGPRTHVTEKGFFGALGAGSDYSFSNKYGLRLEIGIKSFHISQNNLDVNPHGIFLKIGFLYRVS
jgi:hypothetical protein